MKALWVQLGIATEFQNGMVCVENHLNRYFPFVFCGSHQGDEDA